MNKIMRILLCVDSLQMCPRERRCPVNDARVWWDRPSRQTAFCVRQHHSSKWSFHYYSFLHRFSNNMALKLNQVTSANLTLQVWKSKTVSFHCNIHLNVYQTCGGKLRTLGTSFSFFFLFLKKASHSLNNVVNDGVLPTLTRARTGSYHYALKGEKHSETPGLHTWKGTIHAAAVAPGDVVCNQIHQNSSAFSLSLNMMVAL